MLRRVLLVLAVLVTAASPAAAQNRLAFVVGNNAYENVDPLLKAVNDARAVAQSLQQLGFRTTLGENLTRRDFIERFSTFESSVRAGDTVFVFYSGHGVELDGA